MSDEIIFRENGLLFGIACAPRKMSASQVVRGVNANHPCGTSHGWQIASQKKLEDGTKLPAPCLDDKSRRHFLLEAS